MLLAVSLVVAIVFGSGAFLIMQRDLLRLVVGIVLISNAAILFIIAVGHTRGAVPILPVSGEASSQEVSDPLVQAMAITALVISSSVAALLLSLIYRIYTSHKTVDIVEISEAEARQAEALERGEDIEEAEEPEAGSAREESEEPR